MDETIRVNILGDDQGVYAEPVDERTRDWPVCVHEAAHAAAMLEMGWDVQGVARSADGHGVVLGWSEHVTEDREGSAVVLLTAIIEEPHGSGSDNDRRMLRALVDVGGVNLARATARAEAMIATPSYALKRTGIASKLLDQPLLSRSDVQAAITT